MGECMELGASQLTLTTTKPPSSWTHSRVFRKRPPPAELTSVFIHTTYGYKVSRMGFVPANVEVTSTMLNRSPVKTLVQSYRECPCEPRWEDPMQAPVGAWTAELAHFPLFRYKFRHLTRYSRSSYSFRFRANCHTM